MLFAQWASDKLKQSFLSSREKAQNNVPREAGIEFSVDSASLQALLVLLAVRAAYPVSY